MSVHLGLDYFLARIPEMQEKSRLRAERDKDKPVQAITRPLSGMKLPPWPEPIRAIPNGFLRSALFGSIGKGKRRYIESARLAALDGLQVIYTGMRLDQGDLDAYESVLHAVRLQELGSQCRVTTYYLLKLLGKTDSGKNRTTLYKRLTRLRATAVEIRQGRHAYIGGLIDEAYKDAETQEWVIVLNPKLRALFAPDQFTMVGWAVRRDLAGQLLAQWLHGFYSSHAKPYPIKIATLHRLCGSETTELWKFRQTLRKALEAVASACTAHGEVFRYTLTGEILHIEKKASEAQRRHLLRKAAQAQGPHI